MQFLLFPFAILAGLMNPLQAGCVATLSKALGRPVMACFLSVVGTLVLTLLGSLVLGQFGLGGKVAAAPWWSWLGGLAGAVILISQPIVAQKIGAGPYVGMTVTAAAVASIVIDNFGWLGFQQHEAGICRVLGAALMIGGVALVAIF